MQVRLKIARASAEGSQNSGDVINVSDAEGVRLIEAGHADAVRSAKQPQKAVSKPKFEKAVK